MATHPLLAGLHVTHAGFFPRAEGHFIKRETGCSDHVLIVCLRGTGWAEAGGRRQNLKRGDIVGLRARHPHVYGASDRDPWSIAWVHFTGKEADAWIEHATGRKAVLATCHTPAEKLDSIGLDRIHSSLAAGYGLPELLDAAAALRICLALVSRRRAQDSTALSAHERVDASITHLRENWMQPHSLPELAAAAGVSVTHYTAIFRRLTGFPPIDFIIRQRIQQGATLLATTPSPIAEIAMECGFNDPYYFSRSFKRITGSSPRNYRRIHRSIVSDSNKDSATSKCHASSRL
ncbi:AraC family transcriptional regulator [Pelagicoccus sp. SDUM812002]|uniref:AraC family transcriptional regulator n=1 Tax=Pelagicoccus sp. SDUM812002 TaxID=3041266 RepID=UPI00280FEF62|nr:AraC family transcriptional regulator [Pelagicoccus sp. SDUM812002]MDQ8188299.1 AraC family transcriptional regulator [Pelagicoccus sp. SDUM812002]